MILNSILINKFLFFGDTLVYDRWKWISSKLPKTKENWKLLDVGCGSGAFTLKASSLGYHARGLTWDKKTSKSVLKGQKNFYLKIVNLIFSMQETSIIIFMTNLT